MVIALLIASTIVFALATANVRIGTLNVPALGGCLFAAAFVAGRWPW